MNRLIDGTEVMITEHPQLNTTKCVVSNYDSVGLSDAYLKEQLASQGVRDIRRIQKRSARKHTHHDFVHCRYGHP